MTSNTSREATEHGLSLLADAMLHQLEAQIHEASRELTLMEQSLQLRVNPTPTPRPAVAPQPQASGHTPTPIEQHSGQDAHPVSHGRAPGSGAELSPLPPPFDGRLPTTSAAATSTPHYMQPPYSPAQYGDPYPAWTPLGASSGYVDRCIVRELRKPVFTLDKFRGDPATYVTFTKQFKTRILPYCENYDEAMTFLLQYTEAEPNKIARGYIHLDSTIGFQATVAEFERRYGDPEIVALAYVQKALDWPSVGNNDASALDAFCIFLREVQYAIQEIDALTTFDNPDNIRKLLCKLPVRLREKWRGVAFDLKEKGMRVRFHNFVEFVSREAKKQTDPVYGEKALQPFSRSVEKPKPAARSEPTSKPQPVPRQRTLLNTTASATPAPAAPAPSVPNSAPAKDNCPLCHANHRIYSCKQFRDKSPEERYSVAKTLSLCFNCLSSSHRMEFCRSSKCHVEGCGKMHHTMLHRQAPPRDPRGTRQTSTSETTATSSATISNTILSTSTATHQPSTGQVYFQLFPVYVSANGRAIKTVALLDSASQTSVMQESLAKELGLKGKTDNLTINTMSSSAVMKSRIVSFKVRSTLDGASTLEMKGARTLDVETFQCSTQKLDPRWEHCQDLGIPDCIQPVEVQLLIGMDQPEAHLQVEVRRGQFEGPLAVHTPLGWSLMGTDGDGRHDQRDYANVNLLSEDPTTSKPSLDDQLSRFWSTESFGVTHHFRKPTSIEDCEATTRLEATTVLKDGHYEVEMLWRDKSSSLPNNFPVAKRRLDLLTRRLARDPQYALLYDAALSGYIDKGYARRMTPAEACKVSSRTWYLPHSGVIHPHKPGKLRVVFDAAASYKNQSLNGALMRGPDLLNSLFGVLQRFRLYDVALVGDIEAMYHQVHVPETDSDSLRFLWKSDLSEQGPPDTFQMCSHIFGATDSPSCCLYALRRTVQDHAHEFSAAAGEALLQDMYMDDLIKSISSVRAAVSLVRDIPQLAAKGGFRIHKFLSNRVEVLSSLDESECAITRLDFDLDDIAIQRTLGMQWDVRLDAFIFAFQPKEDAPLTKRGLVSVMSSVFDPLGFISPFTIRAKLLAQMLWKSGVGWDDPLPEAIWEKWTRWLDELKLLDVFQLPRHHPGFTPDARDLELHTFADASEASFAAVSFLRYRTSEGAVHVSFLGSKSRVAPLKLLTIPRLELQGAVLAARLGRMLTTDLKLPIAKCWYWTDSEVVLRYLQNDSKRFKPFVANRVAEILDLTQPENWRHVPTNQNPADICTRGLAVKSLTQDNLWFRGPDFLRHDEATWPNQAGTLTSEVGKDDPELKKEETGRKLVLNTVVAGKDDLPDNDQPRPETVAHKFDVSSEVNLERFSELKPLLRRTAWMLRAVNNFASPVKRFHCKPRRDTELAVAELKEAELHWIRSSQREVYGEEFETLQNGDAVGSKSPIVQLTPFYDEEAKCLRVGGRLSKSNLPKEAKFQLLLPPKHHFTNLIITATHRRVLHGGPDHTIAELRTLYWPVNVRVAVKSCIRRCFLCILRKARPLLPRMADLPRCRVDVKDGPFHFTGVDYWGPMQVKQGRSTVKRWGCLFTCLAMRAVHLEVADGLDTENFLLCLRNFISRRGHPEHLYSDNGTNFHGADNTLKESLDQLDQDKIHRFLAPMRIQWHFNPPSAPHFGGAWERLVQSVKRALNATLNNTLVSDTVLRTAVTEVEGVLNSRPLTHVSADIEDNNALTPNHFLLGRADSKIPPVQCEEREVNSRHRWRQCQALADRASQRWLREYLPGLTVRSRWTADNKCLSIGDLVSVVDEHLPRGCWELGRVTEVHPGEDGRVRAVDVKTPRNTFRRPAAKICLLEENV